MNFEIFMAMYYDHDIEPSEAKTCINFRPWEKE